MFIVARAIATGPTERREMVRKENTRLRLPRLVNLQKTSICYAPVEANAETHILMREIDKVFTK